MGSQFSPKSFSVAKTRLYRIVSQFVHICSFFIRQNSEKLPKNIRNTFGQYFTVKKKVLRKYCQFFGPCSELGTFHPFFFKYTVRLFYTRHMCPKAKTIRPVSYLGFTGSLTGNFLLHFFALFYFLSFKQIQPTFSILGINLVAIFIILQGSTSKRTPILRPSSLHIELSSMLTERRFKLCPFRQTPPVQKSLYLEKIYIFV